MGSVTFVLVLATIVSFMLFIGSAGTVPALLYVTVACSLGVGGFGAAWAFGKKR